MKYFCHFIIVVVILSSYNLTAVAGSEQGHRGPLYLSTAWNLSKGDLTFHGNSRFYFNNKTFTHQDDPTTAVTFWDVQGGINVYYGLGKHYQIGLSQILYQDNHKPGKGYNLPDDLFLKAKFGSFLDRPNPFKFGITLMTRVPIAKNHNIQLEPYSAGRVEFGVIGLASFSKDLIYPEDGLNTHLNLGIIHHNDNGKKFDESNIEYINKKNSYEIIGGMALIYPISKFDFSMELYGNYNISKPPPAAYSRHNYLYFTPGITYKTSYWLSLACGFDFRLTKNKSNKSHLLPSGMTNVLPTYPTWRVNFSVKINLISRFQRRFEQKEQLDSVTSKKGETNVFEEIAVERKKVENAELELEKIRDERKRMDEILIRLRKALELNDKKEKSEKDKKKK